MEVIQSALDQIAAQHNGHHIQVKKNREVPSGRPDDLYWLPENEGRFYFAITKSIRRKARNLQDLNIIII